ncbi:MAG: hypothetical protein V2B18_21615 [Pseudomonadota bacterium]
MKSAEVKDGKIVLDLENPTAPGWNRRVVLDVEKEPFKVVRTTVSEAKATEAKESKGLPNILSGGDPGEPDPEQESPTPSVRGPRKEGTQPDQPETPRKKLTWGMPTVTPRQSVGDQPERSGRRGPFKLEEIRFQRADEAAGRS